MGRFNFGLPDQQTQTKSTNRFTFGLDKPAPNQPKDVVQGPAPDYSYQPKTSQPKQTQGMGDLRQYESTQPLPKLPEPERDWKDRLGDFGSGFWDTGMHNASQGYHADSAQMYYAMSKDPKNSPEEQAEWKRKYDEMSGHGPKEQTTTSGKVGAVTGEMLGYAPEYLMGGKATEGAAKAINSKLLPKLSPKAQPYADRAVKDSLAFATIGPMESDTFQEIPGKTATNAALGAGFGVGTKALGEGLKLAGKGVGKGVEKAKGPQLKLPEYNSTPQDALKDAQNAYKRTPSQHDVRQRELEKTFEPAKPNYKVEKKPLQQGINDNLRIKDPLDTTGRVQKQNELESVFGGPRKTESYAVSTGEQRAERELMDGIEQVENYTGHNDILSIYPPGTTIDQAYADIAKKTGIDLPKLMRNWENASKTTQKSREGLDPDYKRLGKVSGVFPELKPRERFKPVSEDVAAAREPVLQSPERRTWTNEDVIKGTTGDIPYPKRVELPKLKKVEQPKLPEPKLAGQKKAEAPKLPNMVASRNDKNPISLRDAWNKTYAKSIDNLDPIKRAEKSALGKVQYGADSAYKQALNTRHAPALTSRILTKELVDSQGNSIGKSFKERVANKIPDEKTLNEFSDYLVARHAPERMSRGEQVYPKEMGMTKKKINAKIADYEKQHPEFKELAEETYSYSDQFGEAWLVDTGLVSRETWKKWRADNPNYVENYRHTTGGSKSGGKPKTLIGSPVKDAPGSDKPILNVIESKIETTDRIVKIAKRNEAMQTIAKMIDRNPEEMKGFAERVKVQEGETLDKSLLDNGMDGMMKDIDGLLQETSKQDKIDSSIVTFFEDGKRTQLRINDPLFLEALEGMKPKTQEGVLGAVNQVTRMMKNLTTGINPTFGLLRNIWRDIPTSYAYSKSVNDPLQFSKDLLKSVVDIWKDEGWAKSYYNMGGGHSSSAISADRNMVGEAKAKLLPGYSKNPKNWGKIAVGKVESFNNALESIPRVAEYGRYAKKGSYTDRVEGLYEAGDVTVNFNKYGNRGKEFDAFIPYLNASLQGLDKTRRAFTENPGKNTAILATKGFTAITLPSVTLYAINHDDPNYQKLSSFTKDNYFLIPKGDGTFFKIPKPRELGVIFGSDVERVMRKWWDEDPEAFDKFGETIKTNFAFPTRTIAAPANDLRANKDFLNRQIVSGSLEGLSKPKQYEADTSELSKALGRTIGTSPVQTDYLIKSYTGGIGKFGLPLSDSIIHTATGKTSNTNSSVPDVLNKMVTADPLYSNDALNDFYGNKDKLDTMYRDAKNEGDGQTLQKIEATRAAYNRVSSDISGYRKEMQHVQNDSNLSKEQKEEQMRKLQYQMTDLARWAKKMYPMPKE